MFDKDAELVVGGDTVANLYILGRILRLDLGERRQEETEREDELHFSWGGGVTSSTAAERVMS